MTDYPEKLNPDGITEAILEVRFASSTLSELLIGQLASGSAWKSYDVKRLPGADIPQSLRNAEPNFQYQPVLQLTSIDGRNAVKIGDRAISWHAMKPYPGWQIFREQLGTVLEYLFSSIADIRLKRLGFRYVNLFTRDNHQINSVTDLNFKITIADAQLSPPMNINYIKQNGELHRLVTRIASPEFVIGSKEPFTALVDVDVFTPENFESESLAGALGWIDEAHNVLKAEFFPLLTKSTLGRLQEK